MHFFKKLSNSSYTFSSCDGCEALCCDGSKNILYAQIILSDFEQISKYFPILFIFGELGFAKPVVVLTNGKDFCKYITNNRCTIYEERPSICRVYPLSAHIDNETYIDEFCPGVSWNTNKTVNNEKITKDFDNEILNDYQDKYIQTHNQFEQYRQEENFELVMTINGVKFFKFNKDFDDEYLKIHHESLKHLNSEYFKF